MRGGGGLQEAPKANDARFVGWQARRDGRSHFQDSQLQRGQHLLILNTLLLSFITLIILTPSFYSYLLTNPILIV